MAAEFLNLRTGKRIKYTGPTWENGLMRFVYTISGLGIWRSRNDFLSLKGKRTWYALNAEARELMEEK